MVLTIRKAGIVAALLLVQTAEAQRGGGQGAGVARGGGGADGASFGRGQGRRPVLFGFALECVNCQPGGRGRIGGGGGRGEYSTESNVWTYTKYPRVVEVLPNSLAESGGIRAGDILVSIDGLSMLTDEGAARFANATAGDEVRLTFERASKLIDIPLLLGRFGTGRGQQMVSIGHLSANYSGAYGNIDIDMWSDDPVNVSRDSTGAMILRTGTTVIRLRADAMNDSLSGGRGGGRGAGARGRGRGGPPGDQPIRD